MSNNMDAYVTTSPEYLIGHSSDGSMYLSLCFDIIAGHGIISWKVHYWYMENFMTDLRSNVHKPHCIFAVL